MKNQTLGPSDLETIVNALGMRSGLQFVPSGRWGYDATTKTIRYDRQGLLNLADHESTGLIYQKVGHARHSQTTIDPWTVAGKATRNIQRKFAKDLVHPRSVVALCRMLEEERIERIQRNEYGGLAKHALPPRHTGYRQKSFKSDMVTLAESSQIDQQQTARIDPQIGVPPYWIRAGIAMQALAAGAPVPLPQDMPWPRDLQDEIKKIADAPSCDALMAEVARLLPRLVDLRVGEDAQESQQPQGQAPQPGQPQNGGQPQQNQQQNTGGEGDGDGDGEASQDDAKGKPGKGKGKGKGPKSDAQSQSAGGGEGSGEGDGEGEGEGEAQSQSQGGGGGSSSGSEASPNAEKDQPGGSGSQREQRMDQMQAEVEAANATQLGQEEIEFVQDSTDRLNADAKERLRGGTESAPTPEFIAPAWNAVRRAADPIIGVIRKAVREHFLRNIAGERLRDLRRGRFDSQRAVHSLTRGRLSNAVFQKTKIVDERLYDIYLLMDVSGSMIGDVEGPIDPTVFSDKYNAPQAWMLSARLAVALADTFKRYPMVSVGMGVHEGSFHPLKSFNEAWTQQKREEVMRNLHPRGGTNADIAYEAISHEFRDRQTRKLLIHLTDGGFSGGVVEPLRKLYKDGVEIVVMTIGEDASHAVSYGIPAHCADQVDDSNIGSVLTRHFRRMIRKTGSHKIPDALQEAS